MGHVTGHPEKGKSHKSKKLNYICSINPETITKITGKITGLNKEAMFENTTPRAILEFIIISRD